MLAYCEKDMDDGYKIEVITFPLFIEKHFDDESYTLYLSLLLRNTLLMLVRSFMLMTILIWMLSFSYFRISVFSLSCLLLALKPSWICLKSQVSSLVLLFPYPGLSFGASGCMCLNCERFGWWPFNRNFICFTFP